MNRNIILGAMLGILTATAACAQQILYVNQSAPLSSTQDGTSWTNAYRELRDALNSPNLQPSATNPVQIWVAKGTYKPTDGTNQSATFAIKSYLSVLGGFAGTELTPDGRPNPPPLTVLSGDIGIPQAQSVNANTTELGSVPIDYSDPGTLDNCYNVITAIGVSNAVLDTLVVTAGTAFGALNDTNLTSLQIDGMITPQFQDPDDTNDVFNGQGMSPLTNTVVGGGLYFQGSHDRPATEVTLAVEYCQFVNNSSQAYGGGIGGSEGNLSILSSTFINNQAVLEGGAFWGLNEKADMEECTFFDNSAGAWGGAVLSRTLPSTETTVDTTDSGGLDVAHGVVTENTAISTAKEAFQIDAGTSVFQKIGRAVGFQLEPAVQLYKPVGIWDAFKSGYDSGAGLSGGITEGLRSAGQAVQAADSTSLALASLDALNTAYTAISLADLLGDLGFDLAVAYGADTNNAAARGWEKFDSGFNTYATPSGWALLLAQAVGANTPTFDQQAHNIKELELGLYNLEAPDSMLNCTFAGNVAPDGGALCLVYQNSHVEGCDFYENTAENGGAVFSTSYNTPFFISCVFEQNEGTFGHSAIANVYHSRAQIVNCTVVNNMSTPSNGFAIGVEMGSEIQIANSILWGNVNGDPANTNGGADLYVATRATLGTNAIVDIGTDTNVVPAYTNAQQAYDAAGPSYGDWIGICELNHCCVQSLNTLPVGTENFMEFSDITGQNITQQIDQIEANYAMADNAGTLPSYGFINIGEGIRPGFLTATNANTAQDPRLSRFTPAYNSVAVDAGNDARLNNGIIESYTDEDFNGDPRLQGAALDMGAVEYQGYTTNGGNIVYVNQAATGDGSGRDWADAMTNLQPALDLPGSQVWVAQGTYYPTSGTNPNASFVITNGNVVLGGFRGGETSPSQRLPDFLSILSGNIGNPNIDSDNSETVVVCEGDRSTVLDGFVITKGRGQFGAGLSGTGATIQNCTFLDNAATFEGGAVLGSGFLLKNCSFSGNSAPEGGAIFGDGLEIQNCSFTWNSATRGGGLFLDSEQPSTLYNCLFASNSVAGVDDAGGGAIYGNTARAAAYNCTLTENNVLANSGGVVGGAGIEWAGAGELLAQNCIFWANQANNGSGPVTSVEQQQIHLSASATLEGLSFNLIQGLAGYATSGVSNLLADPAFQNTESGNFQLSSYSSAIDAGSNQPAGAPTTDLAGNPRIVNRAIDMGALEFQGTPTPLSSFLTVTSTCDGNGNIYLLQLLTNAVLTNYSWAVNRNDGNGFVSVTNDSVTSGAQTAALTLTHPPLAMGGFQYRLQAGGFISQSIALRVSESVIYVKAAAAGQNNGSSWANAFTNLGAALSIAAPCSQIWVAAGTYYPTAIGSGNRQAGFQMAQGVAVYGGFAGTETSLDQRNWMSNLTVLSGCIEFADTFDPEADSFHVIANDGSNPATRIDATAILDGFTLFGAVQGSVLNIDASPTFAHCVFIDNESVSSAIVDNGTAAPSFSQCIFARVTLAACGSGGASFTVTNTPDLAESYQWQVNDGSGFVPISNGGNFSLITNGNGLSFNIALAVANGASYRFTIPGAGYAAPSSTFYLTPPSIYYVNAAVTGGAGNGSSWANAFSDLAAAISNAPSCSQLWVARGRYSALSAGGVFSLKPGVGIYGGFAGTETNLTQRNLSLNLCYLTQITNFSVIANDGTSSLTALDASAVLDGFAFSNITNSPVIRNVDASPTIRNCTFTGNTSYSIWNQSSQPSISGCVFSNNSQIAILNQQSDALVQSNIFSGQANSGGNGASIVNNASSPAIDDCVFMNNKAGYGAAIYNEGTSRPLILNCIFNNNTADSGGAVYDEGTALPAIRNCLFYNNSAPEFRGGAIADSGSGVVLVNCTFANNQALFSGAAMLLQAPSNVVENCIFWDNRLSTSLYATPETSQIDASAGGLQLSHSLVQGLGALSGSNNIGFAPLFAGESSNNYRLSFFSPAINAGLTTGLDATDLDGNPRVVGSAVDMGAYEFQTSPQPAIDLLSTPFSQSICVGGTAAFAITAATGSNYTYLWETNIGNGNYFPITSGGAVTIVNSSNSSTLSVSSATLAQNGLGVEVTIGNYVSSAALLTVDTPEVIYVSPSARGTGNGSSWANAFTNFTAAVNAAPPCSQLWVAGGFYSGTGMQLKSSVTIYGGFAGNETTLAQRNWTNHPSVLTGAGAQPIFDNEGTLAPIDSSAVLDGFTFTGGGLWNAASSPVVRNCTFTQSSAAAVQNLDGASPAFVNDIFASNSFGAMINENSTVLITNCLFEANSAGADPGGAIESDSSVVTVIDSKFLGNNSREGGAVDSRGGATFISRSYFESNSAPGGGALSLWDGSSQIVDSLLANNTASEYGAAIYLLNNATTLRNCTVAQNSVSNGRVGGVLAEAGSLTAWNCILWNNLDSSSATPYEAGQLDSVGGGGVTVSNSCITGLSQFQGHFNIPFDPILSSSFVLSPYSPCVNAGNSASAPGDPYDLSHNARIVGSAVDMGAFELQSAAAQAVAFLSVPTSLQVCPGENAIFTLVTETNAGSAVVWTENSAPIHNDANHLILQSNTTSILIVSNVSSAMSGWTYQFSLPTQTPFVSPVLSLSILTPQIIYVNASAHGAGNGQDWADAFTTLQPALAMADNCSQIWVAHGVYSPTTLPNQRVSFPFNSGMQLFGGFAGNETSLSQRNWQTNICNLVGTPVDAVVAVTPGADRSALLDGFFIMGTNGQYGLENIGASPTVRHCVFAGNSGSAFFNWNGSDPLIDSCLFSNNLQTAVYSGLSSLLITNCSFVSNLSGAIYNFEGSASVSNSLFDGNSTAGNGAGIYDSSATDTVVYCTFRHNSSSGGGGAVACDGTSSSILNCLFYGNSAVGTAGAIFNRSSVQTIVNSTIAGNQASYGGGLGQYGGTNVLLNSIVWGNSDLYSRTSLAMQWYNAAGSEVASNSDVEGWPGGVLADSFRNFGLDPLFTNPGQNDYTLQGYSPAIGSGAVTFAPGLPVDLAGSPRVVNNRLDQGAYTALQDFGNPPAIVSPPASQSACPGGNVSFTVDAVISGWQFYNSNLASWQSLTNPPSTNFPFAYSYSISTTNNEFDLNLSNVTTNMNGFMFRPQYSPYSGYTGSAFTLTILPPSVIYVNAAAPANGDGTSWASAFSSISTALNESGACHPEVWVTGGIYTPPAAGFNVPAGVALYGGFTGTETKRSQRNWSLHPAILDGGGASMNMVSFNAPADTNTTLDGFILQNVNGLALAAFNCSPAIQNCVVRQITGAGIFIYSGNPFIANSSFVSNTVGAGWPAVVSMYNSQSTILNCVLSGNGGNGVQSYWEGGTKPFPSPNFLDCLVTGNSGTGITLNQGAGSIVNCTISANGGGLNIDTAEINVYNCIIWDNGGPNTGYTVAENQILNIQSLLYLYSSCIYQYDPAAQVGDLDGGIYYGSDTMADPYFRTPVLPQSVPTTTGDFHLQPCSPLIAQGNLGVTGGISLDLDGTARTQGGTVDLGAYEFAGTNVSIPILITLQPSDLAYCPLNLNQFSVGVSTNGAVFQWQVNQGSGFATISDNVNYSGSSSAVLTISNAVPAMNGYNFRCLVANSAGCTAYSQSATLAVPQSTLWYVKASAAPGGNGLSWQTAFTNIAQAQANISASDCDSEIWVAAGIYSGPVSLRDNVHLLGGFNGTETTAGQRQWQSNATILTGANPVVIALNDNPTAQLDGFVIKSATVGVSISGGNPQLLNCAFTSNAQAVTMTGGQPAIEGCIFTNNASALVLNQSSPSIQRCVFSGNQATSGAALYSSGQSGGSVANSLFSGNTATSAGAAIYLAGDGSQLTLNNCTVTGNNAASSPSGGGLLAAYNCVFWNNSGAVYGSVTVNNSLQTDPFFVLAIASSAAPTTAGDFHAAPCSPIINAGNNNLIVGALDLDGNPRVADATVDLGAYEYQQISLHVAVNPTAATGSYGTPVQFTAIPNQTNAGFTYQWMASQNGASFANVQNGPNYSGALTHVLTISNAPDSFNNNQYVCVVQNGPCQATSMTAVYSNVYTLPANFVALTNGTGSQVTFNLPIGIQTGSASDQTIAVYPMETGRLLAANGSLSSILVSNGTVVLNPSHPFKAGEPVSVTATEGLQVAGGFGIEPFVWEFQAPVSSSANRAFLAAAESLGTGTDVAVGDVNGDGSVDFLAATANGAGTWTNDGRGGFRSSGLVTASNVIAVALADVDGNGTLDAITVRNDGTVHVAFNNGSGAFTDSGQAFGAGVQSIAVGDVNGDGFLDIAAVGSGPARVFLNSGSGTFIDSGQRLTNPPAASVTLADLNGDGALDLIVPGRFGQTSKIWFNNGLGGFTDSGQSLGTGDAQRAAAGDLNGDGFVDLVIANADSPSTVWTNNGAGFFTQVISQVNALRPTDSIVSEFGGDIRSPTNLLDGNPNTFYQVDSLEAEFLITPGAGPTVVTAIRLTSSGDFGADPGQIAFSGTKPDGTVLNFGFFDVSFPGLETTITIPISNNVALSSYTLLLRVTNPQNVDLELADVQFIRGDVPVLGPAATDVALGDIDGNGALDAVLARPDGSREIWLNDGHGNFARDSRQLNAGSLGRLALADFDGDGDLDLLQAGGAAGTNSVALLQLADARGNDLAAIPVPAAAFSNKFVALGDGALTQVKIIGLPAHGLLSLNGSAVQINQQIPSASIANLVYSGNAGFDGMDEFSWQGSSSGGSTTNILPIYVLVQNAPGGPITVNETILVNQGGTAAELTNGASSVLAGDSDSAGEPLTGVELVSGPSHGTLLLNFDGTFRYTHDGSESTADGFVYRVWDAAGASTNGSVQIIITNISGPVAQTQSVTNVEDAPFAITLSGSSPGGGALAYTIVQPPSHGVLSGSASNLLYSPTLYYSGPDSFTFSVNDGQLSSAPAVVSITLLHTNHSPIVTNTSLSEPEDAPFSISLSAFDPDGNALTYSVTTPPAHGSLTGVPPNLTYTPVLYYVGPDSFSFQASDDHSTSGPGVVSITLTHVNHAPVAVSQSLTEPEDSPFNISLSATDVDGDSLTYAVLNPPSHGSLSGTPPKLVYTPVLYYVGADSFTFAANDGHTNSTPGVIGIQLTHINHAPLTSNQFLNIPENTAANITLTAVDLDGNPITFSITQSPLHGALSGTPPNLTYLPIANFLGNDSFGFAVADNQGNTNTGVVSLSVLNFNLIVSNTLDNGQGSLRQAIAVASSVPSQFAWNIGFAPALSGETISLTNTAPDAFGPSALVVSNQIVIDGRAAAGLGIARNSSAAYMRLFHVTPTGSLTLDHLTVSGGFVFGVSGVAGNGGGGGGAGLGGAIYNEGQLIISNSVISNNLVAGGEGGSGGESQDVGGNGGGPSPGNGGEFFSDFGQPAGFGSGGGGSGGANNLGLGGDGGFGGGNGGGTITGQGDGGAGGFGGGGGGGSYADGGGGLGAGGAIFNNGGAVQIVNSAITGSLANGGFAPPSSIAGAGQGLGSAIFSRNGTVTIYNSSLTNDDSDLGGGIYNLGDGAESVVTMEGINFGFFQGTNVVDASIGGGTATSTPPLQFYASVFRGQSATINVLPPASGQTITAVQPGLYGGVTFTATNLTYKENGANQSADTFNYFVTGPHGLNSTGVVLMTIIFTNRPPVAGNVFAIAYSGRPVSIPVLASDFDPDGDAIFVYSYQNPSHGTVYLQSTNFIYQATDLSATNDSFTYQISDTYGALAGATVFITISPPVLNVSSAGDSGPGTLRSAIDFIQSVPATGGWTINLAGNLAGTTIKLETAEGSDPSGNSAFVINDQILINGSSAPGVVVARDSNGPAMRLFWILGSGDLTLQNLTLAGGLAQGAASSSGLGGAIYSEGFCTLDTVRLTGHTAQGGAGTSGQDGAMGAGGAIYNASAPQLTVLNCQIDGNGAVGGPAGSATNLAGQGWGGAIYNDESDVLIQSAVIVSNVAGEGGGIFDAAADSGTESAIEMIGATVNNPRGGTNVVLYSRNGGQPSLEGRSNTVASSDAPVFQDMPDQTQSGPFSVNFTLALPPGYTSNYQLFIRSANEAVLPSSNLGLSGNGGSWTLEITNVPGQYGETEIDVAITDGDTFVGTFFDLTVAPPNTNGNVVPSIVTTNVLASHQQFQFQFTGAAGRSYEVQASTNLLNWLPVQVIAATNTILGFIDPAVAGFPHRYYRIRLLPTNSIPATLGYFRVLTNAHFQMTLTGQSGGTYQIQTSTNLVNWSA
ncbi:MAG TPA: right-handed parallel beta-helix repeat-containing protein, partial [Verrucomicrobiae bacterium]|nr:right-handed parallel beta-helix repeat-containing protein [Verrucomicrobiae bacterium]